jgi:hypothetical protein
MTELTVTRVVNGKKISPKKPKLIETPKAHFVRQLILQLNVALERDIRLLEKLNQRGNFDVALCSCIDKFRANIISTLDSFPATGQRIPAAYAKKVRQLSEDAEDFISEFLHINTVNTKLSKRTAFVTKWLLTDVQHFVNQFEINYSSIPARFDNTTGKLLPPSLENIPNRHRDPDKERIFLEAVQKYQDENGRKKFMPYKFILPLMEAAGLKFSDRSFRHFKEEYSSGKFGKLAR